MSDWLMVLIGALAGLFIARCFVCLIRRCEKEDAAILKAYLLFESQKKISGDRERAAKRFGVELK